MINKSHLSKLVIVGALCMAFVAQPAYAYWGGGWGWGWHRGWGWGWGRPVAAAAVLGASATAFWIAGHQYYYYDGNYYNDTPQGYVVVEPTVINANVITVNVPLDRGGYKAVVLKRSGNGFIGPQGEFYSSLPRVSQLQVMYGK